MISLLASQAARYSARSARREIDGPTSIDRCPRLGFRPATLPSNHFASTNVRCWTSPARLVPEGTVLRRASSSLSPASFLRAPARWPLSAARSWVSSGVMWLRVLEEAVGDAAYLGRVGGA
jgi:hypothetical protein